MKSIFQLAPLNFAIRRARPSRMGMRATAGFLIINPASILALREWICARNMTEFSPFMDDDDDDDFPEVEPIPQPNGNEPDRTRKSGQGQWKSGF